MNSPCLRKSWPGLALLACLGSPALALGNHGLFATSYYSPIAETVYGVPASYVVPTSYLATTPYIYPTTAYVYPTSLVYPTAYSASSYVLSPTSYVSTAYYRPRGFLFPRRYVVSTAYATSYGYMPTAFYSPTVYTPTVIDYPVVAAASVCCGGENTTIAASPAMPAPRAGAGSESNERAPSVLESVPSNVRPLEDANSPAGNENRQPPAPGPGPGTAPAPLPFDPNTVSPPPAPAPEPSNSGTAAPPNNEGNPQKGPAPDPAATMLRRQAQKPVAPTIGGATGRVSNVLEGKVVSSETRQSEEGVRVILSSRPGSFVDRVATTDAFGRYAIRLPDGDWTVKVAMPSGRVYAVSQITISGGQIIDSYGREIPSLTITR